jgi:hypothetical protein
MAATVLSTQRAVEVSVFVVRAFIHMRRMLADQHQFALKLAEIERKLAAHDQSLRVVFDAIRQLMEKPKSKPIGKIGFHVREEMAKYSAGGSKNDEVRRANTRRRVNRKRETEK